jgi:hypothetical protein
MNKVFNTQQLLFDEKGRISSAPEQFLPASLRVSQVEDKPVFVDFEGGALSSDAGTLLLRETEKQINIVGAIADVIKDNRDSRYIKHTYQELLMQRVSQIASGNEDANDCDSLRDDPIFKMVANRLPETGNALGSQPTMSRFENTISRPTLYRIAKVFVDNFIESYEVQPDIVVLDFDDTEDKVHGHQQLSLFNKYYDDYCYLPLHVYEGLSGKLITTILKPGKRSNGKQTLAIAKRIIMQLRARWADTIIVFRGDGHFSYPEVMQWIDAQENVMYVLGLTGNSVLKKMVQPLIQRALAEYKEVQKKVCLFDSTLYKAQSWDIFRRVIVKVEVTSKGENIRFIVSDMKQAKAIELYQQIYCHRGIAELYIKDHKLYLKSDRTSCHAFEANQFRLFLHSAAYVLTHAFRAHALKHSQWATATMETIRLKFFKIGACIRELKTKIKVALPTSYPLKRILIRSFQLFENFAPT